MLLTRGGQENLTATGLILTLDMPCSLHLEGNECFLCALRPKSTIRKLVIFCKPSGGGNLPAAVFLWLRFHAQSAPTHHNIIISATHTEPRLGSEPLVGESSSASQLAVQFLLPSSSDSCITPALDRDLEVVGHEALLSIPNFKNLELIEVQNNHK